MRMGNRKISVIIGMIIVLAVMTVLSGCVAFTPKPTETPTPTATFTPLPPASTPTITPTPIPPTATPIRTPPALPGVFQSSILNPLDTPHTYLSDTCQYLKMKWDPNNSPPGTVVMIIMYHSITDSTGPLAENQINEKYQRKIMDHAAEVGFQTINSTQLADFMEKNAKIPPRSLMLISDDRHQAVYFETHFLPYLQKFGWKSVTNAWISIPDTPLEYFPPLQKLVADGVLDVQSHGVIHNINITDFSSDDFIRKELFGSISFIQSHFGTSPIAYIWPGGSFTQHAIQIAREAGYRLGFTINPRGPVMFNWVPLSDKKDPMRPSYLPEGAVNDPLMVLPRYWSTDAASRIDEVSNIGEAASAYAASNRDTELLYYDIMCKDTLGPIPAR